MELPDCMLSSKRPLRGQLQRFVRTQRFAIGSLGKVLSNESSNRRFEDSSELYCHVLADRPNVIFHIRYILLRKTNQLSELRLRHLSVLPVNSEILARSKPGLCPPVPVGLKDINQLVIGLRIVDQPHALPVLLFQ